MDTSLREVECPVCLVTLTQESYFCETGHTLCAACSQNNEKCPLCNALMRKQQKNYALEALLQKVKTGNSSSPRFTRFDATIAEAVCPLCFTMFGKIIYVCETGHSVCAECKDRIRNCRLCRKSMGNQRNYALEAALQKLLIRSASIPNTVCTIFRHCPLNDEEQCEYFADNFDDLHMHLKSTHSHSFKMWRSQNFHARIKNNKNLMGHIFTCTVYEINKKLYKICVKIDYDSNSLWFAVQKFESTDDSANAFAVDYIQRNLERKTFSGKISHITKTKQAFIPTFYVKAPLNFFITRSVAGKIGIYGKVYEAAPGGQR